MDLNQNSAAPAAVLELKHPVEWGSDGLITHLYFRRPKFKDIRETEGKSPTITAVNLVCRLTGATPPFLDDLDAEDFMEAGKIIRGFLPESPEDGGNGSEPSHED